MRSKLPAILIGAVLVGLLGVLFSMRGCDDAGGEGPELSGPGPEAAIRSGAATRSEDTAATSPTRSSAAAVSSAVPGKRGVRCRVLNPEGKPMPSIRVRLFRELGLWPDTDREELESALTGPQGQCEFRTPPQANLVVVAKEELYSAAEADASWMRTEVVLRLREGFDIFGNVKLPGGTAPVESCEVLLEPGTGSNRRTRRVWTDAYGSYRIKDAEVGGARLTARHPDYRPVSKPITIGVKDIPEDLYFGEPGLTLTGVVTALGDDGRPVVGAEVQAYPSSWNSGLFLPVQGLTDERGEFRLKGLGAGNLRVVVRHPDHSAAQQIVRMRSEMAPLQLELAARSRVRGQLVGEPVPPGTRMTAAQANESLRRVTVGTDGRFEFEGTLSAGFADLRLITPTGADDLCFASTSRNVTRVSVLDGEDTEFELEVQPAARLAGRVLDPEGQPVEGVRVAKPIGRALGSPLEVLDVTDAEGQFRVAGLSGGATLVFRHVRFAEAEMDVEMPAPGETTELEPVRLALPGEIRGRVLRDGSNVGGAFVFVRSGRVGIKHATTDRNGTFVLRGLPAGNFWVKAAYGAMPITAADKPVPLTAGQIVRGLEVSLSAGRKIVGEVVTPTGEPVLGALVSLTGRRSRNYSTDEQGRFEIEVPRGETITLVARLREDLRIRKRMVVGLDQTEVSMTLDTVPTGTLRLQVYAMPERRVLNAAVLRVESLDDSSLRLHRHRQRNIASRWIMAQAGSFNVPRFPAGHSKLTIHAPGYVPWSGEVTVSPGRTSTIDRVVVDRGAKIRGRVTDASGRPIAGAHVHAGILQDLVAMDRRSGEAPAAAQFTDRDGRFELRGIGAQARNLVVQAAGFALLERELRIPADLLRRDELAIEMNRGVELSVALRRGKGADGLLPVILLRGGAFFDAGLTDERGIVVFPNLPDGEFSAGIGHAGVPKPFTVRRSEAVKQRVELTVE